MLNYHLVKLSFNHIFILAILLSDSHFDTLSLSNYHPTTLSLYHIITLSYCHSDISIYLITFSLSLSHIVILHYSYAIAFSICLVPLSQPLFLIVYLSPPQTISSS